MAASGQNSLTSILNPSPGSSPAGPSEATSPQSETNPPNGPKKRSKVSRACDCCRKKKIKCDAVFSSGTGVVTQRCSNCVKTNDTCLFTRVPLKRGPVKGYNKRKSINVSSTEETGEETPVAGLGTTSGNEATHGSTHGTAGPSGQVVLPPLSALTPPPLMRPQSANSNGSQAAGPLMGQQTLFWKAPPSEFPQGRRLSTDSNLSFGRKRLSKPSSPYQSSDYSDSDDDSSLNFQGSKKLNRPFQVPHDQQQFAAVTANRTFSTSSSPRNSIHKSSFSNTNSLGSINRGFQNLMAPTGPPLASLSARNSIQSIFSNTSQGGKRQWQELWNSVNGLMDLYYAQFHHQYPVLGTKEMVLNSCYKMDHEDHLAVFELLETSLALLVSGNGYPIVDIHKAFEKAAGFYCEKETIGGNSYAKEVFTTCLAVLNLCVIMSGARYSYGFSVAFAYFRDWLVFNDPVDDLNFNNLINVALLDNIYSLYFGTPRGSTVCFSIDSQFAANFFEGGVLTNLPNVNNEFMKIAMHLLLLGNQLQNATSIESLLSLQIQGMDFKFLQTLAFNNELVYFCNGLNNGLQQFNSDEGVVVEFLLGMELNISKLVKKLNNIIDEQIDDLEMYFNHPLVGIVMAQCTKILRNLGFFVRSLVELNKAMGVEGGVGDVGSPSFRFAKFDEAIALNLARCTGVRQASPLHAAAIAAIANAPGGIPLKKVSAGGKVVKEMVLLGWIRAVNEFWTAQVAREGMGGWMSV